MLTHLERQTMATNQEKQELVDILKFTPRTYRISMWGYGGEKVMGTVDPKAWDYCLKNRIDLVDIAWGDYDEMIEEQGLDIDLLPFTPGSWYECDNMAHVSGVSRSSGTLQIEDENSNTIFQKSLDDIVGGGCDGEPDWCCQDEVWIGQRKKGEVVFVGSSNEKGTFFEGDIKLKAPFNIEKLELYYDEVDGEEIVNCVYYDGEEIENWGSSTDGKSSDMNMVRVIDDNGNWERYEVPEEDWDPAVELDKIVKEQLMTEWYPKNIKPVHVGEYEVDLGKLVAWPFPRIIRAEWTGKKWQSDAGEKVKIQAWRGLVVDPSTI